MTFADKDLRGCLLAYALTAASLFRAYGEGAHGRLDAADIGPSLGFDVRIAAVVEREPSEKRASWIPRRGR